MKMMRADDKVKTAIRQREALSRPYLKICKIFEVADMGVWLERCQDRIAGMGLIDGEDVCIDAANGLDLEVTATGLVMCKGVLRSYVSDEILEDALEALQKEENVRKLVNEITDLLREVNWRKLFWLCKHGDEKVQEYARMELVQRLRLGDLRMKLYRAFCSLVARVKYRKAIITFKKEFCDTTN